MSEQQAFCTHCGTALQGAKFCPECGAMTANAPPTGELSDHRGGGAALMTAPAPAPPAAVPRPGQAPARRRLPVALAIAALVAVAIAAAIVVFASGGDDAKKEATSRTVATASTTPAPAQTATAKTPAAVTEGEAKALAYKYAGAYSAESAKLLDTLLAPDFERNNAGDPPQDRAEAMAAYAAQFKGLADPHYELSSLQVTRTHDTAIVAGDYTIASGGGKATGSVLIDMARVDGQLLITRVVAMPDSAGTASAGDASSGGSTSGSEESDSGDESAGSTTDESESSSGGSSGGGSGGLLWYGNQLPPTVVPDLY